ncbi:MULTISPECIES: STAS domain-containing protein [unclassified Picosynechococcus]|uniref:STAS domain-containing protein n=1 Tax=unclassified Picosynechococcus TaxID=3079910 RepID=UPI00059DBA61|nr:MULTISPECIES: STAS domain-containing protein [unclassified Picosynechococcus]AMA08201.1 anti-sigma F factor antagonist [Picosynechococcus sp. PCC 73109]ANV89510.1 anti-sigma F factor antagonist [Picosynechococcus sp. PCC 8807]
MTVSLRGTYEVIDNKYQIFRLTGLLDAFSEPVFSTAIKNRINEGPHDIILSLAQIDFVDSSGIGALVQLVKHTQNAGGTMQVVTNPRVTQTVKLVRLEKFLSLRNSIDEAIAHLDEKK